MTIPVDEATITYDEKVDTLYIKLDGARIATSDEPYRCAGTVVNYDGSGRVVGLQITEASDAARRGLAVLTMAETKRLPQAIAKAWDRWSEDVLLETIGAKPLSSPTKPFRTPDDEDNADLQSAFRAFADLTYDERLEVLSCFCSGCFRHMREGERCHCLNDE